VDAESIEKQVRKALADIIDPETGLSITRMELIQSLKVKADGSVSLVFRPSSPVCPMAYSLANRIQEGVGSLESVAAVHITVENFERAAHLESVLRSAACAGK